MKWISKITKDVSWWLLFFLVIYVILLVKAVTVQTLWNTTFFGVYSFLITAYILSRFLFAYFHKQVPPDPAYTPTVSFVVPAKDEGGNIFKTIFKLSESRYPKEKMEVIAINDGSTDNTYPEMLRAKEALEPGLPVRVVNWEVNKGKREGMAEGVRFATGEIVIFVDSDSFIDGDCVRHLVKYFADFEVGAVSGHTDVYNKNTNLLTRMQAVRYYIAFSIYKVAESIFGNVTCCPGCCSAYRREYLMEFLEDWRTQTFLGAKCTFGDDRSLTNWIIRKYSAVHSDEARAATVVPDTFKQYLRQQQRWKKSWVRETIIASTFMWRKHPLASLSFYSYVFLALSSIVVFFRAMLWIPYTTSVLPWMYLSGILLMLLLHGLYYRVRVGDEPWFMAILGFWFNTVLLMYQLPWAIITIKDGRWGTR